VDEGSCVEDYEWLALATHQCGNNPWQGDATGDDELAQIDSFFTAEGFDLLSLGLVDLPGDVAADSTAVAGLPALGFGSLIAP